MITERTDSDAYMFQGGSQMTYYLQGHIKSQQNLEIDKLVPLLNDQSSYVLIGSPALDEDFDLPSIDVLIVAAAGRSPRRVLQRAGRILRVYRLPDGTNAEAHIVDFDDRCSFVLQNQSKARKKLYLERYGDAEKFRSYEHLSVDDALVAIKGPIGTP
jgi:superfamily II DNA or RNA helicase